MPNWCTTYFKFEGDRADLREMRNKIEEWTSENAMDNGFGRYWLGNIVLNSGLVTLDDFEHGTIPYCKGQLIYVDASVSNLDEYPSIVLDTETAWSPCVQMWQRIIDKYKWNIEFTFQAEECGTGLYLTNDVAIAGEYNVDIWDDIPNTDINESICIADKDDVVNVLQAIFESGIDDIDALLQRFHESEFVEYMSIHQWEYCDIEECN